MYERKIPLDMNCGISIAMEVILSKWKFHILSKIDRGVIRPKDLIDAIPDITKRVLHSQLKQLEFYQIVNHITYPEVPVRTEYFLTKEGKKALSILTKINEWGLGYAPIFKQLMDNKQT
jgi:DNA-binding HxlR family transcriptional regulator